MLRASERENSAKPRTTMVASMYMGTTWCPGGNNANTRPTPGGY
ncbi:hypothetical protein ACVWWR_005135 [Bradyrhizobium sp. LM3.2]